MSEMILRHRLRMTTDTDIGGLTRNAEELLQVLTHGVLHGIIRQLVLLRLHGATHKSAQEYLIFRRTA